MSREPLLAEDFAIGWHALAALAALLLGATQLAKSTPRHRTVGDVWAAFMPFIAASGFWINDIRMFGPFSPIHLLSILVLVTVPLAVGDAHNHREAHRSAMISLYFFALIGAGIFTLLPAGSCTKSCLGHET